MTITTENFIKAIRKVVASNPDFVYDADTMGIGGSCVYVTEKGTGSCGVGRALRRMGVPAEFFFQARKYGADAPLNVYPIGSIWSSLMEAGCVKEGEPYPYWAAQFQMAQDSKAPWKEAEERADLSHPEHRASSHVLVE